MFVDENGDDVADGTAVKMVQKKGTILTGNELQIFGYSGGNYTVQASDQDNVVWNLTNFTTSTDYTMKLTQTDIDGNLTTNSLDLTYDSSTEKYTSSALTEYGAVLSAKHNFFDDIQDMIEALNSADRDSIQSALDKIDSAYDQANIGQSGLGGFIAGAKYIVEHTPTFGSFKRSAGTTQFGVGRERRECMAGHFNFWDHGDAVNVVAPVGIFLKAFLAIIPAVGKSVEMLQRIS